LSSSSAAPDLFGRLVAALVTPPAGEPPAVLAAYQPPLAVVEVPLTAAGIVLLDVAGAAPDEVGRRLRRVLENYQGGVMSMVVVGGGDELRPTLAAVDKEVRDPAKISLYHLDDGARLLRVGGRRSGVLERAARALPAAPLPLERVPELIGRARQDRDEAARFAAGLRARFGGVTAILLGSCVLLYALAALWSGRPFIGALLDGPGEVLSRMGANGAEWVRQGEIWRLLASTFLHGSAVHLLVNMAALQSFGGFLEAVLGWRRYLVLYVASGLAGSLASALIARTTSSVGASGALWGLMLAGFALSRARQTVLPVLIARHLRNRLLSVLVLNVLLSFLPFIDKSAHFGGGAVGFLLVASGLLAPRVAGGESQPPVALRALVVICALALAGSVMVALAVGRPWAA
jgi:membrane associated rhomboid family serine protease